MRTVDAGTVGAGKHNSLCGGNFIGEVVCRKSVYLPVCGCSHGASECCKSAVSMANRNYLSCCDDV